MANSPSPWLSEVLQSISALDFATIKDGVKTSTVATLSADERTQLEDCCLDLLLDTGEPRAATALGELRSRRAIPALNRALHDHNTLLCVEAAHALWKVEQSSEAREVLLELSYDSSGFVRRRAMFALGQTPPDAPAATAMVSNLLNLDFVTRRWALDSLTRMFGLGHHRLIELANAQIQQLLNGTDWRETVLALSGMLEQQYHFPLLILRED